MKPNLVLIRHGQSEYNLQNRFAGWVDTPLTEEGIRQAKAAGEKLKNWSFYPAEIWASPLGRAQDTAKLILGELGIDAASIQTDARLVERSYGALSGKNKAETLAELGEETFKKIRRGYAVQPPALDKDHPLYGEVVGSFEKHMKGSFAQTCPMTESLKDVVGRVTPFIENQLTAAIQKGRTLLVVAHGNSLRAIIKQIKQIDDEGINKVELETAQPTGFEVAFAGGKLVVKKDTLAAA